MVATFTSRLMQRNISEDHKARENCPAAESPQHEDVRIREIKVTTFLTSVPN